MDNSLDTITAYTVGGISVCINWNGVGEWFLLWGGVLLLAARLTCDIPKAYHTIKEWLRRKRGKGGA